ncbi:MAG: TlpA family protein disulfide reductase [Bacteriovoracaceae bacterium]|nr:TlpA family protein disulfide reductase [Bacteriovoracaceae bacterium]
MHKKLLIVSLIVICTFGYAVFHAVKLDNKLGSSKDYFQTNTVLKKLPDTDFKLFFEDRNVELLSHSSDKNAVIVHFWATWCGPCEKEFPEIVELTRLFKDNKKVSFLFVTVGDTKKDVLKFLKKYNVGDDENFLIVEDNDLKHQKHFGTYKLPETFMFNKKQDLVRKFSGAQNWQDPAFVDFINSI